MKTNLKDKYKVDELIGYGSFGTVYLVEDLTDPNEKKYILLHFLVMNNNNNNLLKHKRKSLKRIQRFLNEKYIGRELDNLKAVSADECPSILKYYENFYEDKYLYIVTEYCEVNSILSQKTNLILFLIEDF